MNSERERDPASTSRTFFSGYLIYKLGRIDKRVIERFEKEDAELNKRSFDTGNCKSDLRTTALENSSSVDIDKDLHSWQLAVYGRKTMNHLFAYNVLLSMIQGLGAEIGKNLVLVGVESDDAQKLISIANNINKALGDGKLEDINPKLSRYFAFGACSRKFHPLFHSFTSTPWSLYLWNH
ncbi:hypothetical protein MLD38_005961 [Melastoma candidum]|uniref:Uncharacterized protein n=1 Tax=Melastoma candidum TaxID=119954 RepID=A0ACB9RQJ0_9MYRT|nr:hypothetical protein MLD38_005961 [Melastoma candidum]